MAENESLMSCSFTGHRQIKPSHSAALAPLLDRAIAYAYSCGCRSFYSGGAVGFDTHAALRVLTFRATHPDVRLVMLLPCENQDERWSESQKALYREILSQADEVVYTSRRYTPTCIKERNRALAEHADIMIAYLSDRASGTGQTVAISERLGKRVYNLYPTLDRQSAN